MHISHRTTTLFLLIISLTLYLLPANFLISWRLTFFSYYLQVNRFIFSNSKTADKSLETARGSNDLKRKLADRKRQLEEFKYQLFKVNSQLAAYRKKMQQLVEIKEFIPTIKIKSANVIARTPGLTLLGTTLPNNIIIDRGYSDGITLGTILLQGQAVLGQVINVGPRASKAILINNSQIIIAGRHGNSRSECYVRGQEQRGCQAIFFTQRPEAKAGDLIFTSGLLGYFPKDIIIGKLLEQPQPSKDQRTFIAALQPLADLNAIEQVLLVKRQQQDKSWE